MLSTILSVNINAGDSGSSKPSVKIKQPEKPKKASNAKQNNLKLNTLRIQGNKELPKALYIVPWQEVEIKKGAKYKQQLVLHSLYGDLFDPITANKLLEKQPQSLKDSNNDL